MRKNRLLPMNLHFFGYAEGGEPGEPEKSGTEDKAAGEAETEKDKEPPKVKSFDEILKEGDYQEEFNRRVKAVLENDREKWKALMDDKLSEAEKLAKMNKEEKADYMRQKQEKELQEREANLTKRELMAEAKSTLLEKKIPVEFAEILNYTDADSCSKSIELVENIFQKAVEANRQELLKGGKPIKKAPQETAYTREAVAAMSPEEINENWDSISHAMETWK